VRTQSHAGMRIAALGTGCAVLAIAASFAISPALAGKTVAGSFDVKTKCSSNNPCFQRTNAGTGPAIVGNGSAGGGLVGNTTFFSTRTGAAGVSGVDLATPNPSGQPLNNSGVSGTSQTGMGVFGQTSAGIALRGYATTTGTALDANGTGGDGVFGTTLSNTPHVASAGVFGEDVGSSSQAYGVLGFSRTGIGVQGDNFEVGTNLNAAVVGLTFASNLNTYFPAFPTGGLFNSDTGEGMVAETSGSQAEALAAANFGGGPIMRGYQARTEVMELDNTGNMILAGKLTQHGHPGTITRTNGAGDVVMYSPSEAAATVEDVGEGSLIGGQAYVHIDARFRATMSASRPYLVFVTPQGDSEGLYVTQKTATGFAVREHGAHSSIAFDYRIVAEPIDGSGVRLPSAPHLGTAQFTRKSVTHRGDFNAKKGVQRY
jgi:hypothetical protein